MVAETLIRGGWRRGALLLALLCALPAALAAPVTERSLFQVQVPVADQGADARAAGEGAAFRQVLRRIAAAPDLFDRAAVQAALASPQRYYVRAGYARRTEAELAAEREAGMDPAPWLLALEFDRASVLGLLAAENIPVWTGDRPEILVWMAVEGEDGRRSLVGADHPWAAALEAAAAARGLALTVPLVDLEDLATVTPRDVWARFREPIGAASLRYGTDAILLVRLAAQPLGSWRVDWQGDLSGIPFDAAAEAATVPEGLGILVDALADGLLERYAIQVGSANADVLWLQVDGIDSIDRYAALLRYLRGVNGIDGNQVIQVQERSLLLRLDVTDTPERVLDLLRLEARLVPEQRPQSAGGVPVWRGLWRG
jgi:hypothetical protein